MLITSSTLRGQNGNFSLARLFIRRKQCNRCSCEIHLQPSFLLWISRGSALATEDALDNGTCKMKKLIFLFSILSLLGSAPAVADTAFIKHKGILVPIPIPILDDPGSDNRILSDLLITSRSDDFYEAWVCFYEVGEPAVYLFFDNGVVPGFEDYTMGLEITFRDNETPFAYTWGVLSPTSIILQSPPQGVQDEWTDIEFYPTAQPNPLMKAISRSRGALFCSLKGRAS